MNKIKGIVVLCVFLLETTSCMSAFGKYFPAKIEKLSMTEEIGLFDELEPVYTDTTAAAGADVLSLSSAKNASVSFYVMVDSLSNKIDQITIDYGNLAGCSVEMYKMLPIPVEFNTGIIARTELINFINNPYVIREAPFYIYEALEPISSLNDLGLASVGVSEKKSVILVRLIPGKELIAGKYSLKILAGDLHAKVNLNFYNVLLPGDSKKELKYINWHNDDNIAVFHNIQLHSEEWWAMLGEYAKMMRYGRQNTVVVWWDNVFEDIQKDGKTVPVLKDEFLTRYLSTFQKAGITGFSFGFCAGRTDGVWDSKTLTVRGKWLVSSSDSEVYLTEALIQLGDYIKKNLSGYDSYVSLSDEPVDSHAKDYLALCSITKKVLPDIPILEATKASNSIVGSVDIWCPTVDQYQINQNFFIERQKVQEQVWTYTCLDPGGPYLNRLLDQERLRPVLIGWAAFVNGTTGYLHWGLNQWRPGVDPFNQSVVSFFAAGGPKTDRNQLPAGDSHVLYPGKNGPMSSTRFEAHRIGMEDYLLLNMLKENNVKMADELAKTLFRTYNDYEKDVEEYRGVKKQLLTALSAAPMF